MFKGVRAVLAAVAMQVLLLSGCTTEFNSPGGRAAASAGKSSEASSDASASTLSQETSGSQASSGNEVGAVASEGSSGVPVLAFGSVTSGMSVASGFLVGTIGGDVSRVSAVQAAFGSGSYQNVEWSTGASQWKAKLPVGEGRIAPEQAFTVLLRAVDASGAVLGEGLSGSFRRDLNRDHDGDGAPDLAVAAPGSHSSKGAVQLYKGGKDRLLDSSITGPDLVYRGGSMEMLGNSAVIYCDFNGDGYADLVSGSIGQDLSKGAVQVFPGGSSVFPADAAVPVEAGEVSGRVLLKGSVSVFQLGGQLACGDLNGDGVDDLVVSAWRGDSNYSGSVHVFLGSSSGEVTSGDESLAAVSLKHSVEQENFGSALAVGDFNADGIQDLAVGIPHRGVLTGAVHVYFGRSDLGAWAVGSPDQEITGTGGYFGGSLRAGEWTGDAATDLWVTSTVTAQLFSGAEARGLGTLESHHVDLIGYRGRQTFGDFTGDGVRDLASGNPLENSGSLFYTGKVSIFPGTAPSGTGFFITATSSAQASDSLTGTSGNGFMGETVVAFDFDLDGISDLFVGETGYGSYKGRFGMFHGAADFSLNAGPLHWFEGDSAVALFASQMSP